MESEYQRNFWRMTMSKQNKKFEVRLDFFKSKTVYSDEVIGCYLSLYGDRRLCSGMQNCGCKSLKQCETMHNLERGSHE